MEMGIIAKWWHRILDASVLFSFGHYGFKRHAAYFSPLDEMPMAGKHVLITGGSSGIGRYTAEYFLKKGAEVTVISRNPPSLMGRYRPIVFDLADYSLLDEAMPELPPVDILINNAGGMPPYQVRNGNIAEDTFSSQVMGHLALLHYLISHQSLKDFGRVIFVSSGGMYLQKLDLSDLCFKRTEYNKYTAYANAKRAQVILTELLAKRYPQYTFSAMHPGWVETSGVKTHLPLFYRLTKPILRSVEEGADTIIWLGVTEESYPSGQFWFDRKVVPTHVLGIGKSTPEEEKSLWSYYEEIKL